MAALIEAQPPTETIIRNFSVPEAARYTGLSEAFLNRLRSIGGGPTFYKLGTRVLYARSDIDQWLSERRRKSTSDTGKAA